MQILGLRVQIHYLSTHVTHVYHLDFTLSIHSSPTFCSKKCGWRVCIVHASRHHAWLKCLAVPLTWHLRQWSCSVFSVHKIHRGLWHPAARYLIVFAAKHFHSRPLEIPTIPRFVPVMFSLHCVWMAHVCCKWSIAGFYRSDTMDGGKCRISCLRCAVWKLYDGICSPWLPLFLMACSLIVLVLVICALESFVGCFLI